MRRMPTTEFSHPVLKRFARAGFNQGLAFVGDEVISSRFRPRTDLLRAGSKLAPGVYLILSGFAARYLTVSSGRRQITALVLPGDLCGLQTCFGSPLDHSVGALSAVEAALISRQGLLARCANSPEALRALWAMTARDEAIARQWLLNVGQRSAIARVAHLLCEICTRLRSEGLVEHESFSLPITQSDLADALALTPVHVNRTLMELRRLKLITLAHQQLVVHDMPRLRNLAGFDPAYLGERIDAGPPMGRPSELGATP